jgi:ATP-dependent helicase HrpA
LKTLPKSLRQRLPSPVHIAELLLQQKSYLNKSLPQALSQLLQDKYKVRVGLDAWALEKLPTHLNIRYSVIDEKGEEIKNSRDINLLQKELADTVNSSAIDNIRCDWEKEGINHWDFGELPVQIPLTGIHGLIGYAYPALHSIDGSVNLRLFSDQKESAANHLQGVAALYAIHFADKLKQLKKNIALNTGMKAIAANIGNPKHLEQSIINRVKKDLFFQLWRKQEDFVGHANSINSNILKYGQQVFDSIAPVLKAFAETHAFVHKFIMKNRVNSPVLKFLKEIQAELGSLVPFDFPELYTLDRMKELPRYIKALALRAERGSLNLASAQKKMQDVMIYSEKLQQILTPLKTSVMPPHDISNDTRLSLRGGESRRGNPVLFSDLRDCFAHCIHSQRQIKVEDLFWMIEEYKVSLFAQELKTPYPVSTKKLDQLIKEIENTI